MKRGIAIALFASAVLLAGVTQAQDSSATWDGLVQVESKKLDVVFLMPGADFREYTKVMLDPTEVAFEKNWQRDFNRSTSSLSTRVSDRDVERAITGAVAAAGEIFAAAWAEGGYAVVQHPGPDVLRVRTGVLNVTVNAPEVDSASRTRTYSSEAGQATFFVEVRDSQTNALLGRAVDQRIVGDNLRTWRTRSSNRADFSTEVKRWAEISVTGLGELKALSPVEPSTAP